MNRVTRVADGGSVTTTYTSATQRDISTALTATSNRQDQIILDGLGRVIRKTLVSDPVWIAAGTAGAATPPSPPTSATATLIHSFRTGCRVGRAA